MALAGFVILVSAFVVQENTMRPESTSAITWSGSGGFAFLGGEGSGTETSERIRTEEFLNKHGSVADYLILPVLKSDIVGEPSTSDVSLEALLAQLSPEPGSPVVQDVAKEALDVYSFIPQGLISTANAAVNQTPQQQALYEYGNRAGAYIRAFDESHQDMIQVLKDAYADRSNQQKKAAAIRIGEDYEKLGQDLEAMTEVPASVGNMHLALAKTYQEAGKKMVAKLNTKTDEEFLASMNSYNTTVLEFTRRYVLLVSYFSAAGVQFSKTDPGSVFMFTAVSF
jgi:hypothetical protein